jgi:hypothetical protein
VEVSNARYEMSHDDDIIIVAGGEQHFEAPLSGADGGQAGAVYRFHVEGQPGAWSCPITRRWPEGGGWAVHAFGDKSFVILVCPRTDPPGRWEHFADICECAFGYVVCRLDPSGQRIKVPLVGNGIYGTGDKHQDSRDSASAIAVGAKAAQLPVLVFTDTDLGSV